MPAAIGSRRRRCVLFAVPCAHLLFLTCGSRAVRERLEIEPSFVVAEKLDGLALIRSVSSSERRLTSQARIVVARSSRERKSGMPLTRSQKSSELSTVMSDAERIAGLRTAPEHGDVQLDPLPVAAQRPRAAAERLDVALAPAGVLGVRRRLDRVQLDDAVGVLQLEIDAAARLDPAADDPRDLLQPGADVRLDR